MGKEPLWRKALCWGAVITFLTLPLFILTMAIVSRELGWMAEFEAHIKEYKFLSQFYQSITALVFGLSGLRSLDRYIETKNGNGKPSNKVNS